MDEAWEDAAICASVSGAARSATVLRSPRRMAYFPRPNGPAFRAKTPLLVGSVHHPLKPSQDSLVQTRRPALSGRRLPQADGWIRLQNTGKVRNGGRLGYMPLGRASAGCTCLASGLAFRFTPEAAKARISARIVSQACVAGPLGLQPPNRSPHGTPLKAP